MLRELTALPQRGETGEAHPQDQSAKPMVTDP
jgi:hypothetical protein